MPITARTYIHMHAHTKTGEEHMQESQYHSPKKHMPKHIWA